MKPFLAFCLLLTLPSLLSGQGPIPIGEEFQVNTDTNITDRPGLAVAEGGEFVVTWSSCDYVGDTYSYNIEARRYDSDANPAGDPLQVRTQTFGPLLGSAVDYLRGGEFVVTWTHFDLGYVEGRRFSADGTPDGDPFRIDMIPSEPFELTSVESAAAPDGSFVVVWSGAGAGNDTDDGGIQGRRFAVDGNAAGDQFQINTHTTGYQYGLAVATGSAGNFVVVWDSSDSGGSDTSSSSIQMRRFDSTGTAIGEDFQVNTFTTSSQFGPDVAFGPSGEFWVAWTSTTSGGTDEDSSIRMRRFGSDGLPMGSDFQVNSFTPGLQRSPRLAANPEGEFVVVWQSAGSAGTDTEGRSIQGRRFASDGMPVGEDFQVNSYTRGEQMRPTVGFDGRSRFVVSWFQFLSVPRAIRAKRLVLDCGGFGGDSDGDGPCDEFDLCPGFDDRLDEDDDGIPDGCDECFGDNATGDADMDDICDDLDCDDVDPEVGLLDDCGVCGGDNSTCGIFEDGLESGDTSAWLLPR